MHKYTRKVNYTARDSVTVSVTPSPDGKYAVRETNRYTTNISGNIRNVTAVTIVGDYDHYHEAKHAADEWYTSNVA